MAQRFSDSVIATLHAVSGGGGVVEASYSPISGSLILNHQSMQALARSFPTRGTRGPILGGSGLEALFHESTHAYLDRAESAEVRSFVKKGIAHYESNGLGWRSARVFDEAAAGYVGHRAGEWGRAMSALNMVLSDSSGWTVSQARGAQSMIDDLRQSYNAGMSERVFGYDHFGNRTSVAISDEMKKFLDSNVLEGRIGDDFDQQFASELKAVQAKIDQAGQAKE